MLDKKILQHAVMLCWFIICLKPAYASVTVKVTVEGVEGEIKKNVLAYLSIEQYKNNTDLTISRLKKLHKKADVEIRQSLEPFGYYSPQIQSQFSKEGPEWHANYLISTGPPTLVKSIEISFTGEGSRTKRFLKLISDFPLKERDVLDHRVYEQGKRSIYDAATKDGYFDAQMIKSVIEVFPEKESALVIIQFDTGPRYKYGEVEFIQDDFKEDFLKGFVLIQRGNPYSISEVLTLQNTLNDSDYFESVEVVPEPEKAINLEVPVKVKLRSRKRHKFAFGLGYGTDTGVRASAGWENRRVNKKGHRFKTVLRLSEIRSSVTAEYTMPLDNPRTDSIIYAAGWLFEDTKTSESEKFFGSVRYNHMRNKWKESMYLSFEQEEFEIGDDSGSSILLMPGISWTRIKADNTIFTGKGHRIFFDLRGAHSSVISDSTFLQLRTQMKLIRKITSSGRIILRGDGGISIVDEFSELPPSVRFFAGGDKSVRGYAYNTLGPEDDDGDVVGGRNLIAGSIEYEHMITDKWSAALFYDVGNAVDSIKDRLKNGVGFGLRWKSPVGPVRVDIGFPLDETDKSWRLHFVLGPDL